MPNILVTNDDGIHAPGLRALVKGLTGLGTISVVAPSSERSAAAQSLTVRQPIFCEQIAEREWSVEGTPADAMMVALHRLFPKPPDIVISGINRGPNLGENIFYSGTVGAATEAVINHVPAFAISLAYRGPDIVFTQAALFARRLAELILQKGLPAGVLLNVNVPLDWKGGVRLTRQSGKLTRTVLQEGADPRGRVYYWLTEEPVSDTPDPESDYAAVFSGQASITPVELERTHEPSRSHLAPWAELLESTLKV
ncbi:MAG TPA: 5'/3'-nucleotidase SurE [Candidatus Acidoferrales bacterium]|jgi:5'-nucleotidase|nr:5'/3'-nucleotidase SurE [Candidatus Acidoferrales bacterium]